MEYRPAGQVEYRPAGQMVEVLRSYAAESQSRNEFSHPGSLRTRVRRLATRQRTQLLQELVGSEAIFKGHMADFFRGYETGMKLYYFFHRYETGMKPAMKPHYEATHETSHKPRCETIPETGPSGL